MRSSVGEEISKIAAGASTFSFQFPFFYYSHHLFTSILFFSSLSPILHAYTNTKSNCCISNLEKIQTCYRAKV